MALQNVQAEKSAQFDINTAADKAIFSMSCKCKILRAGLIVEGSDAGGATVAFDKRPLAGSDTGRGAADVAEITIPASDQQGKVLYEKPSSEVILEAGDQVVVEVTAEGVTALNCVAFLELIRLDEVEANMSDMSAA